ASRTPHLRRPQTPAPHPRPPPPAPPPCPSTPCTAPGVRHVPGFGDSDRRPPPEQTPVDLDRAELGRVLQDLHQLRDDVEVHGSQSYTSSRRSVSPSDRSSAP